MKTERRSGGGPPGAPLAGWVLTGSNGETRELPGGPLRGNKALSTFFCI